MEEGFEGGGEGGAERRRIGEWGKEGFMEGV